jgi:hypothetical protein
MKRRPVVYVLCGFIGAGKTTFARKLEADTGAVRITKDEWLIRLFGNDPTFDGFATYDARICELSRDFAFHLAGKGVDVILDEGFWAREERMDIRRRIDAIGAEAVLYYLHTPIETIRERVAARNLDPTPDSFMITSDMLERYLPHWEPPREDEGYILVNESE